MEKLFSIGEAAKEVQTTSETLRHYDRIGLVKPGKKDEWTNYRYYTAQDIVRLNTVRALQQMDLPVKKIKEVLEYNDLKQLIDFLNQAEKKIDEKIASLEYSKTRITAARAQYESSLSALEWAGTGTVRNLPERVILLSDRLESPSLDKLWNYLRHFYDSLSDEHRDSFEFQDQAGIYTDNVSGRSRLFAVCIRYSEVDGLKVLPAGEYLCADCEEKDRQALLRQLVELAEKRYNLRPEFIVQQIIVSGILNWRYQLQIYLGDSK